MSADIIEQIKKGAEFTYNGYPARYVGARIDPGKIAIEYNAGFGTNAAYWTLAAVSENTRQGLVLVPKKVKFYVNIYKNADGTHSTYAHSTANQAIFASAGKPGAVKLAHEVEIEL